MRELLERLNDYRSLGDKRSFEKYARQGELEEGRNHFLKRKEKGSFINALNKFFPICPANTGNNRSEVARYFLCQLLLNEFGMLSILL